MSIFCEDLVHSIQNRVVLPLGCGRLDFKITWGNNWCTFRISFTMSLRVWSTFEGAEEEDLYCIYELCFSLSEPGEIVPEFYKNERDGPTLAAVPSFTNWASDSIDLALKSLIILVLDFSVSWSCKIISLTHTHKRGCYLSIEDLATLLNFTKVLFFLFFTGNHY